jgi:hypothetical protein
VDFRQIVGKDRPVLSLTDFLRMTFRGFGIVTLTALAVREVHSRTGNPSGATEIVPALADKFCLKSEGYRRGNFPVFDYFPRFSGGLS